MKIIPIFTLCLSVFLSSNINAQENRFDESPALIIDIGEISSPMIYEEDLLIAGRNDAIIDGEFMATDSSVYFYNAANYIEKISNVRWDFSQETWVNNYRSLYEYDTNGNRTLIHVQNWENNDWVDDYQNILEFSDSDQRTLLLRQSWNDNGILVNDEQVIYEYNEDDQLISFLVQQSVLGQWVDYREEFISYDADGLRLEKRQDEWNGVEWLPRYNTLYMHDENGNRTEINRLFWSNSEWVPNRKDSYGWDSQQNRVLYTLQLSDGTVDYENFLQREYFYDSNNILSSDIYSRWENGIWQNDNLRLYSYDDRENNNYTLIQDWSVVDQAWEDEIQLFLYYQFVSNINEPSIDALSFDVYPNPSNGQFQIKLDAISVDNSKLEIYSMDGKKLKETILNKGESVLNLDLGNLGDGSYLLTISSQNNSSTKKIIISNTN